jgi:small subunit ribosomal protein S21
MWQENRGLHRGRARARFRDPEENGMKGEAVLCKPVEVVVGDRGLDRAVKHLKRKMASEGILRELKRRRHYMKPSVRRRKKEAEAARRRRKRFKQLGAP